MTKCQLLNEKPDKMSQNKKLPDNVSDFLKVTKKGCIFDSRIKKNKKKLYE